MHVRKMFHTDEDRFLPNLRFWSVALLRRFRHAAVSKRRSSAAPIRWRAERWPN